MVGSLVAESIQEELKMNSLELWSLWYIHVIVLSLKIRLNVYNIFIWFKDNSYQYGIYYCYISNQETSYKVHWGEDKIPREIRSHLNPLHTQ